MTNLGESLHYPASDLMALRIYMVQLNIFVFIFIGVICTYPIYILGFGLSLICVHICGFWATDFIPDMYVWRVPIRNFHVF